MATNGADSAGERQKISAVSSIGLQRESGSRRNNLNNPVTVIKQGYMTKQGGGRKNWKKRWFSLQRGGGEVPRLFYYKNLNENIRGQDPLNCIYLDGVKINRTHKDRFEMDCASRTFFFRTDTDEDCDEWVQILLNEIPATSTLSISRQPSTTESQRIEMEGYLVKQGHKIKTKKRRWFVLRGKKLLYYKDDSKNSPLGLIDLEMCLKVSKGNQEGRLYNFEVFTINRNFPLQAESKEDMDAWCELLSEKIDKTKTGLAFVDSNDRAIFSSESSEEEDEKFSARKPVQASKMSEESPPNGSQLVEEFLPPAFRTQTTPVAASATSEARPIFDSDSVFELDLASKKANLNKDFQNIEDMFQDLLQPLDEYSEPSSEQARESFTSDFDPVNAYDKDAWVVSELPAEPPKPTARGSDDTEALLHKLSASLNSIEQLTKVAAAHPPKTPVLPPPLTGKAPEPVPEVRRKKSSATDAIPITGIPTINVHLMTIIELAQLLKTKTEVANYLVTLNELVDRLQAMPKVRSEMRGLALPVAVIGHIGSQDLALRFYALRCLSALAMDDETREEICKAQGIASIIRPLRDRDEDSRVKKQCLRALINLSFTDAIIVQHDIKTGGGLAILHEIFSRGPEDFKGLCLQVLMNASANDANSLELVQIGLVAQLTAVLREGFEMFQRYSCFILTNLTCNDLGKQKCEEAGALPVLVSLLTSKSKEVQFETLRVLTNVSNSEVSKATLRKIEAIPPLVTLLGRATVDQANPETEKVLLHSLWTLTNMATNPENQLEIALKGALPFMTAALLHKNPSIQHQAVWGIANLSTHQICRAKFDDMVSTALIELLKSGPQEAKAQSVKALANLALDETYRNEIGKLGGCAALLDIIQGKVEALRLYEHSLVALLNLSIDAYCRDAVRLANGLGIVVQVLKEPSPKEQNLTTALKLFTNLAFTEENRAVFLTMKAVPLIQQLRNSPTPAISSQATKAAQMLGLNV